MKVKLSHNEQNKIAVENQDLKALIQINRAYILKLVKSYNKDEYVQQELTQMCYMGLFSAMTRYTNQNVPFIAYARLWMIKYIHEWISLNSTTIRIKKTNNKKNSENIPTISIDKSYNDSDEYLSQSLPFVGDYVDEREAIIFDIINTKLKDKDKHLIMDYSELNQDELANKYNCTRQNINAKLNRITNKIKRLYDERLNG
jgi:RNA polymerase sigma factor (sigma-70 family)